MKTIKVMFVILAVIAFIVAGILINQGFNKINNYYNSEDYSSLNENAYVGGDAYNYIINANYATGYFVLAMIAVIAGFGFLIIGNLYQINAVQDQLSKDIQTLKNHWKYPSASQEKYKDLPDL